MHLSVNLKALKVNLAKYKSALHERLSEALAESCRVWLTTVVKESTSVGLPIWSGASIATFSPLASHIAYALALSPVADAPNRIALGVGHGTGLFEPGTKKRGLYTFTYQTTLPHLLINEYNDATQWGFNLKHPGPYGFQIKAEEAFKKFARDVTLPGWGSILDITTIVVN